MKPLRLLLGVLVPVVMVACGESSTSPSQASGVVFGQPSPASGSTIIAEGFPPGAFINRGSGKLSVPVTLRSPREVPWAILYVYLMRSGTEYCGQNLPDTPSWGPFPANQSISFTVTGFQVYQLPCTVVALRAMLHTRNSGLLTPPTASETVIEATFPVSYTIQR
jgi:hypothetical protein